MSIEEVATLLTALGMFLTGLAALITAIATVKHKKEQPKTFPRCRKYRRR